MQPNEPKKQQQIISTSTFFLGCGGVLSAGMLYGVRRAMKQEKTTLGAVRSQPAFLMAFRAFGWGTALCFGAFTGGVIAFSLVTGVRTPEDLARTARKSLVTLGISEELTAEKREMMEKESAELVVSIEKDWDDLTGSLSARVSSWTNFSGKSDGDNKPTSIPNPSSAISIPTIKKTEESNERTGVGLFTHAIGVKLNKLFSLVVGGSSPSSTTRSDDKDAKQQGK